MLSSNVQSTYKHNTEKLPDHLRNADKNDFVMPKDTRRYHCTVPFYGCLQEACYMLKENVDPETYSGHNYTLLDSVDRISTIVYNSTVDYRRNILII